MALDWSKEISFSGLRKRQSKAKTEYPSKTYMNLAVRDTREIDVRRTAIVGIVLLILVALFIKFGIVDFYGKVGAKSLELGERTHTIAQQESQLVGYDEILERYNLYESARMVAGGSQVAALDALQLVDTYVAPTARVTAVELKADTLSLSLADVSLEQVGSLVSLLYQQPIVANVSVSTAANAAGDSNVVEAAMTITLKAAQGSQDGNAASSASSAKA